MTGTKFPDGFLWGTATAGHQNEGDNVTSDTWFLEHVTPTVFAEPSGKATNGWELWSTDLDLVADMGLNAYRFSIEWARVEPAQGEIDAAALDHYEAIVDGCVARGLAPIVTFNHFTDPHWFAKQGAWLDSGAPDRFASYCDTVMARFGDRIAYALTLNEPNLPRLLSWILPPEVDAIQRATLAAASTAAGVERYRSSNVVVPEDYDAMEAGLTAGHLAGKAAIKARRSDLPVGFSISIVDDVAHGESPLRDRKRREVYEHWLHLARDDDFLGVQNYERVHYGPDGVLPVPEGAVRNGMGTAVDPQSLAGAVRYAYEVAQVPVLVTEHGVSTANDTIRLGVLEPALAGLQEAMADGVPVLGYCHWTLVDNFEWIFGFDGQLGLHSLDRTTFERTPKPSATEYARLVAASRDRQTVGGPAR
jgi:beta-glucosidase